MIQSGGHLLRNAPWQGCGEVDASLAETPMAQEPARLKLTRNDDTDTVQVEFTTRKILDEANIADIGEQLTCLIEKDGHILKHEDGSNLAVAFLFLRSEVSVREDWKAIGMKATSSNSFEVMNLRVDKNRSFIIDENKTVLVDQIFQYPFLQFAESTLAVNISGMSIHFMDLVDHRVQNRNFSEYFTKEQRNHLMQQIQAARGKQQAVRKNFYQTLERSWNARAGKNNLSSSELNNVSSVSRKLALISREVVDALFPFCGLTGVDPASEINRVWRDLHTAILHPLLLSI